MNSLARVSLVCQVQFQAFGESPCSGKHHCVYFLLSLLFCKHLCKLEAEILISEHSPHAIILHKKKKLSFISYYIGSTRSQLSLQLWKPLCSQMAMGHYGLSVYFWMSLLHRKRNEEDNQKCGNFASEIKKIF